MGAPNETKGKVDFQFEVKKEGKEVTYFLVTPANARSEDWARAHLTNKYPRWGKSFLLKPEEGRQLKVRLTKDGAIIDPPLKESVLNKETAHA